MKGLSFIAVIAACCMWDQLASADTVLNYLANRPYPKNEYEYWFNRDMMVEAEKNFESGNGVLTKQEQTVDQYLQYLKWREFKATKIPGFPPSRPIEDKLQDIQTTEIYAALQTLPKGGNMHSHEDHQLSKRKLFEIIWNSVDFDNLYILPADHPTSPWTMDFFINPPETAPAWVKVKDSGLSMEDILAQNTLISLMKGVPLAHENPTDPQYRWQAIGPLWGRASVQLISNLNIKKPHLRAIYEQSLSEGVTYIETRRNLGGEEPIYILNASSEFASTNGKQYLGKGGDMEVEVATELVKEFTKDHPEFIGHKRISYAYRGYTGPNTIENFKHDMDNTMRLYQKYPQHVLGFDAVGEEDAGYSLLFFLQNFLSLYDAATGKPRVPLFVHSAESTWPEDLMTSDFDGEIVSTMQNAYETLLLNSVRIGHGYGFDKHPYLLEILRKKQIAVEICPVSSQILGFHPDLRNHPGQIFHRSGIPIILGSDDPGTFGYDNFTLDWYEAFMGWGLNLEDLKKLAKNSLKYSGLDETERKDAIEKKWKPMWDKYIESKAKEACARDYTGDATKDNRLVKFANLLPKEGSLVGTTKVHIFGSNFESAICKTPLCQFGSTPAPALYVSNQHIVCEAPDCNGCKETTVPVSVALDGKDFKVTGFSFTYKHAQMPMP